MVFVCLFILQTEKKKRLKCDAEPWLCSGDQSHPMAVS